jgi:hypothetical protein
MKHLILDYYRRWWWVFLPCIAGMFFSGGLMQTSPESSYEFWVFLIILWSGTNLLTEDFKKGWGGVVGLLPFSRRQMGLGIWLIAVLVPELLLSIGLLGGAWIAHSQGDFQALKLIKTCVLMFGWLGTGFVLYFSNRGIPPRGKGRIAHHVTTWVAIAGLFTGLLACRGATSNQGKFLLLSGVGIFLVFVSLVRALRWNPGDGAKPQISIIPSRSIYGGASHGCGGMAYLLRFLYFKAVFGCLRILLLTMGLFWMMLMFARYGGEYAGVSLSTGVMDSISIASHPWLLAVLTSASLAISMDEYGKEIRTLKCHPMTSGMIARVFVGCILAAYVTCGVACAAYAGWTMGADAAFLQCKLFLWFMGPVFMVLLSSVKLTSGSMGYVVWLAVLVAISQVLDWSFVRSSSVFIPMGIGIGCALLCLFLITYILRTSDFSSRISRKTLGMQ